MPAIASDLFGERSLGTIYNLFGLAPASGSFAVTVGIASRVYAAHTPVHVPPVCARTVGMKDGKCFGLVCYSLTFFCSAGLCCVGCILALVLAWRMASFYRQRAYCH